MSDITVIILTLNEERHIARCINSIKPFAKKIFIIDSGSTDKTIDISKSLGAEVFFHKWPGNHAAQFQWALDNCKIETSWIMKMDADEYVMPDLSNEIETKLNQVSDNITGIYIKRRLFFLGRWIKYGGYYPIWLLRIWKKGYGSVEQRWMDEHIILSKGSTVQFDHDIIDENLNGLDAWTSKHNGYATKEAIDRINKKYHLTDSSIKNGKLFGNTIERKRWLREKYEKFPLFVRPILYFHYRYFFKLGFMDGKEGLIWHFLQGFWYRFLIDAKICEIYYYAGNNREKITSFIKEYYKIDLSNHE